MSDHSHPYANWQTLCRAVSLEEDPDKLTHLITRLNDALDAEAHKTKVLNTKEYPS